MNLGLEGPNFKSQFHLVKAEWFQSGHKTLLSLVHLRATLWIYWKPWIVCLIVLKMAKQNRKHVYFIKAVKWDKSVHVLNCTYMKCVFTVYLFNVCLVPGEMAIKSSCQETFSVMGGIDRQLKFRSEAEWIGGECAFWSLATPLACDLGHSELICKVGIIKSASLALNTVIQESI